MNAANILMILLWLAALGAVIVFVVWLVGNLQIKAGV